MVCRPLRDIGQVVPTNLTSDPICRHIRESFDEVLNEYPPIVDTAEYLAHRRSVGKSLDAEYRTLSLGKSTPEFDYYLSNPSANKKVDMRLKMNEKFFAPDAKWRLYCVFATEHIMLTGPYWYALSKSFKNLQPYAND